MWGSSSAARSGGSVGSLVAETNFSSCPGHQSSLLCLGMDVMDGTSTNCVAIVAITRKAKSAEMDMRMMLYDLKLV